MVEVVPPLLNWLISSRSPLAWLPLNLKPPCEGCWSEADLVLEEPEAELGVTAVVEAVDPEED